MFKIILLFSALISCATATPEPGMTDPSPWKDLSSEETRVIENAGTEMPGSGQFLHHKEDGTYTCARCRAPLFASDTKFESGCGWPSFDDALEGSVEEITDPDGRRTEIRCARCGGHLGHVFKGEGFTEKNTRHCVNSVSMDFTSGYVEQAFFAGGCFWGVEHLLAAVEGVSSVDSGYMGGHVDRPTYKEVCSGYTGHTEAVRVTFDPRVVNYETLAKLFFEIHDPTQRDRQGPDIGSQYRSAIFTTTEAQAEVIHRLIATLKDKGFNVVTQVEDAGIYWPAEDYHQDYYARNGQAPYCHARVERF
jgi:peptide methionine sulfoxide reductase msrA/msrB